MLSTDAMTSSPQRRALDGEAGELLQIGAGSIRRQDFLRTAKEFAYVREHGRSSARRSLVLGWIAAPDGCTRLGIIVSRRYDRRAVQRNRIRRLIRESFRLIRHGIGEPIWLVVIARQRAHGARQQEIQHELIELLEREASIKLLRAAP